MKPSYSGRNTSISRMRKWSAMWRNYNHWYEKRFLLRWFKPCLFLLWSASKRFLKKHKNNSSVKPARDLRKIVFDKTGTNIVVSTTRYVEGSFSVFFILFDGLPKKIAVTGHENLKISLIYKTEHEQQSRASPNPHTTVNVVDFFVQSTKKSWPSTACGTKPWNWGTHWIPGRGAAFYSVTRCSGRKRS